MAGQTSEHEGTSFRVGSGFSSHANLHVRHYLTSFRAAHEIESDKIEIQSSRATDYTKAKQNIEERLCLIFFSSSINDTFSDWDFQPNYPVLAENIVATTLTTSWQAKSSKE